MLSYIEFFNDQLDMPTKLAVGFAVFFFGLQAIGEILELFGKIVPEFMKIRKWFKRKRKEKEELRNTLKQAVDALKKNNELFTEINGHYSSDNIAQRNGWMEAVNKGIAENKAACDEMKEKLDKTFAMTLEDRIESMRSTILSFAAEVAADTKYMITNERFRNIIDLYKDYEKLLAENDKTNGQVAIAYRVIVEEYEHRLRENLFLENIRGY